MVETDQVGFMDEAVSPQRKLEKENLLAQTGHRRLRAQSKIQTAVSSPLGRTPKGQGALRNFPDQEIRSNPAASFCHRAVQVDQSGAKTGESDVGGDSKAYRV